MKNKGLIIITVLITATVLLAAGIIYHQKSSKRTINKGIFGDGLQYVSQIKKDDPVLASAFTNDYLYQDERYSYVIDEEKGYVKRIQLKDSLDWDAIVSVARTQSGKEIQKKAESLVKTYLEDYLTEGASLRTEILDGEYWLVRVDEYLNDLPTGITAPMMLYSHSGELLLARLTIEEVEDIERILSRSEAIETAIRTYQASVEDPPSEIQLNPERTTRLITHKGQQEWQVFLQYTSSREALVEIAVRINAQTGEVIQIYTTG